MPDLLRGTAAQSVVFFLQPQYGGCAVYMKLASILLEHLPMSALSTFCKPCRQAWIPSASIINAPLKRCTSYLNQSSRLSYWVEEDVLFVIVHTHKEFSVGLDP